MSNESRRSFRQGSSLIATVNLDRGFIATPAGFIQGFRLTHSLTQAWQVTSQGFRVQEVQGVGVQNEVLAGYLLIQFYASRCSCRACAEPLHRHSGHYVMARGLRN